MSKPRYDWWPYVKGMIRRYPALCECKQDLQSQSVTPNYNGMPRGGGISNPTQAAALRTMTATEEREFDAVSKAIRETQRMRYGCEMLQMVRLLYWDRSHTLYGASDKLHIHEQTAKEWHRNFVYRVAENYGLLD